MKKLLFLAFLITASLNIYAQALIKGVITDKENGFPLPGATIKVEPTAKGTATNLEGIYTLYVPPGSYMVDVSYLGYKKMSFSLVLEDNQIKELNLQLEPTSSELGEVVVSGILQGQSRAYNQQRSSANLINVVAADQIGRFPDPNVAEALQRIPGTNIDRDEGEGRYVIVRGLAPQFTNISINGEQIPSPEAGVRFMALDAIPSNQLASIELTKAITPDMDGDAVGGSVNLITQTATSKDLQVNATIGGEYNQLNTNPGGQLSLSLAKRSEDNRFGFMVNANYLPSRRASHKNEMDDWQDSDADVQLETFELRSYEIRRDRVGLSTSFDFKPNERSTYYFRTLYSDLIELENRRRVSFEYDGDDEIWTITSDAKDRPETQGVLSFNLGANHALENILVDYEGSFSYARQYTPHDNNAFFKSDDVFVNLGISNPRIPTINSIVDEDGNAFDWLDNDNFTLDEVEQSTTIAKDQNLTAKVNFTLPTAFGNLKFGAKTRFKNKEYNVRSYEQFAYEGDEDVLLSQFEGSYTVDDFGNGAYDVGRFPDAQRVIDFRNANPTLFENDEEATLEERTLEEFDAQENVYATYLMNTFNLGNLTILGGVRFEHTTVDYTGGAWDADNGESSIISGNTDYSFFLPMLHFRYAANDFTNLRASVTRSYARPNFEDLAQGAEFDLSEPEASISNPLLTPVDAWNLDLMAEHYFGNIGVASIGVFYKNLDNFIYRRTVNGTFRGIDNVEISQAVNGEQADLLGLEMAFQRGLDFLPGILNGLGVYANYTYTWSEASLLGLDGTDEDEVTTIALPGQAEHVGNFALYYQKYGWNARISANFNGAYTTEIDGGDLYRIDDRIQWDLSVSKQIDRRFNVFLEAVNLTNTRRVDYLTTLNTPVTREFYGRWARLGLKVAM